MIKNQVAKSERIIYRIICFKIVLKTVDMFLRFIIMTEFD